MGSRTLAFGLGAALLLAGALLWWNPGDPQAANSAARERRSIPGIGAELVSPAIESATSVSRATSAAQNQRAVPLAEAATAEPGQSFRGQVVDAGTREAIFGAGVAAGGAQALTDREGRFDLGIPLDHKVEVVQVLNPLQGTHIRNSRRETWEPQQDGSWVLPIALGPTFRLRLETGQPEQVELWRARVVEVSREGDEHPWSWAYLSGEDPRWFRYDNPQKPTFPGPNLRLEVASESGLLRGSTEVIYSIAGLHPQVPTVYVDERLALLLGEVVDQEGMPVDRVEVLAIRLDGPTLTAESAVRDRVRTTRLGAFELPGLTPGEYDLRLRDARGAEERLEGIVVPAGVTTLADIVLERATPVGSIRGRLVGEGEISAQLHLRAVDGARFSAFDSVNSISFHLQGGARVQMEAGSSTFHFNDLPAGEYELEVLPLDGRQWSPRTMRVSPPAEGLIFTRVGKTAEAFFHVVDAATGRELEVFMLQVHPGHLFTPNTNVWRGDKPYDLAVGQPQRWVVFAPGYVPAHGDEGDFKDEGGRLVADVRLSPGWGATLVLRDQGELLDGGGTARWSRQLRPGMRPPVTDVAVTLDGVKAGKSDARGVVHLRADREPRRIELVGPGWTVLEAERFRGGRVLGDARELVVWLVRR